jgi:glycosyltransferase involved in cell wall biosynthesis
MCERSRLHVMHLVRKGFAGGGMENGIINVTNRLPPGRFRISLCALDSSETFSDRVWFPDFSCHLLPKFGSGIDWRLIEALARLLRCNHVDVLFSHNWGTFLYGILAAKLARVRIIHGEHGKNLAEIGEINRAKKWAKRVLGSRVDRLVTVSQTIAGEWTEYGVPRTKITWIPNGVDEERFRPRPAGERRERRQQFGLPQTGYVLGSVGRFDPIKDYDVLVGAFSRLAPLFPDMHLAFLGDGPEETALREQAKALGVYDRIYWLGRRSNPEDFLAALDIFVLPSRSEGMSNVVLEAMASGVPVLCADLPAHREVFEPDVEGVAVSPCNSETVARAIGGLIRDENRRLTLAAAARKKILARFTIERMVSDHQELYQAFEHSFQSPVRMAVREQR